MNLAVKRAGPSAIASFTLFASLLLAACAQKRADKQFDPWDLNPRVFADEPLGQASGSRKAMVVFLRSASDETQPANIYIDGRYLTTLLPGGYSVHQVCTRQSQISAIVGDQDMAHQGRLRFSEAYSFEPGKSYFLSVTGSQRAAPAVLARVSREALNLRAFKKQVHALSRVPSCGD